MTFNDMLPEGWVFSSADFSNSTAKGRVILLNTKHAEKVVGLGYTFEEAIKDVFNRLCLNSYAKDYEEGTPINSLLPKGWVLYRSYAGSQFALIDGKVSVTLGQPGDYAYTYQDSGSFVTRVGKSLEDAIIRTIDAIEAMNS